MSNYGRQKQKYFLDFSKFQLIIGGTKKIKYSLKTKKSFKIKN